MHGIVLAPLLPPAPPPQPIPVQTEPAQRPPTTLVGPPHCQPLTPAIGKSAASKAIEPAQPAQPILVGHGANRCKVCGKEGPANQPCHYCVQVNDQCQARGFTELANNVAISIDNIGQFECSNNPSVDQIKKLHNQLGALFKLVRMNMEFQDQTNEHQVAFQEKVQMQLDEMRLQMDLHLRTEAKTSKGAMVPADDPKLFQ